MNDSINRVHTDTHSYSQTHTHTKAHTQARTDIYIYNFINRCVRSYIHANGLQNIVYRLFYHLLTTYNPLLYIQKHIYRQTYIYIY